MSKQEALYETEHYFMYKGKNLHIRFIDEYFDMVPRPLDEEKKFLKQDIQENGLHESIKINVEGIVLDGHTRIEICEEIGWVKSNGENIYPKFEVKEFETKEKESEYVLKTNLLRRQLNTFQKVRLGAKLYNDNVHSRREQTRYDILLVLKKHGFPVSSSEIARELGKNRTNVLKVLRGLKEDFCTNYEAREDGYNRKQVHYYHILPRGEEVLYKGRPMKVTLTSLGLTLGVSRVHTERSVFLLNHASPHLVNRLEHGEIGITRAYEELTKETRVKRKINKKYLKGYNKVICPHCEQVSMKKEWKIFNDGT